MLFGDMVPFFSPPLDEPAKVREGEGKSGRLGMISGASNILLFLYKGGISLG